MTTGALPGLFCTIPRYIPVPMKSSQNVISIGPTSSSILTLKTLPLDMEDGVPTSACMSFYIGCSNLTVTCRVCPGRMLAEDTFFIAATYVLASFDIGEAFPLAGDEIKYTGGVIRSVHFLHISSR